MSRASPLQRRRVEQRLNMAIRADPTISAALLVGSLADGTADEYSDLDYYLYIDASPWADEGAAAWWSREELAGWLKRAGLTVDLHFWDGVDKHHLLVTDTRVDIAIHARERQADLASWPQLFFPASSIVKDELGALRRSYARNAKVPTRDHDNDYSALVLNLMNVGIQLCRGEIVSARSRFSGVVEARARLARDLPLGTALWREPTRHAEISLSESDLTDLGRLAFMASPGDLGCYIASELEAIASVETIPSAVRDSAGALAARLRSFMRSGE